MAVQGGDGQRKEEEEEKGRRGGAAHPLLRGWRRGGGKYTHGMHPAQMEALRAMCGALIPSLPAEEAAGAGGRADPPGGKDLERFYLASAADATIPDEVAELMVTRCIREAALLGWVVLWMLSTRVGTLLLCGGLSLISGAAGELPSLRRFADMPLERREAALQRWNRTRWLFPLRIVFTLVKILSHYVFYAMRFYQVVDVPGLSNGYCCFKIRASKICSFNLYIVHLHATIGTKMYCVHLISTPDHPTCPYPLLQRRRHSSSRVRRRRRPHPVVLDPGSRPHPDLEESSGPPSRLRASQRHSCPLRVSHRHAPSPTSTRKRRRSSRRSPDSYCRRTSPQMEGGQK